MQKTLSGTPAEDGYIMPGRFSKHEKTFITWPPKNEKLVSLFRDEVVEVAKAIAKFEEVNIIADPADYNEVKKRCGLFSKIIKIPTDAAWIRDNGPMFVKNKNNDIAAVHFNFNGRGNKFPYKKVRQLPNSLAEYLDIPCYQTNFILEGGAISIDGEGTLIATEQTLLHPNRNGKKSKDEVEKHLYNYLGITKVIWLYKGLVEDSGEYSTDGHVDNVVEYISPGKVMVQTVKDKLNPNYKILEENLERLKKEKDARGRNLELIEMDVLPYIKDEEGLSYAVPYTNYYIVNGAIIFPKLGVEEDERGFEILQQTFPNHEIIGVPSAAQAFGGGGLGCITQQLPISNRK